MNTVGKQLQEARLAKNWTPELAARETKIKVARLRDLEADDYTHFSSPTYARGFVRTYARALGLDEYKLLRQLDNKLPEDDNASFVTESGIPYVPQPSRSFHSGSGSNTGLYVVVSLGFAVLLVISFVLFQAYRAGEFPRIFADSSSTPPESLVSATAKVTSAKPEGDTTVRALPVDPNAPVPAAVDAPSTNIVVATTDTNTNAAPAAAVPAATNADIPVQAVKALPVSPDDLAAAPPPPVGTSPNGGTIPTALPISDTGKTPPRALPVDLNATPDLPPSTGPSPASSPIASKAPAPTTAHDAASLAAAIQARPLTPAMTNAAPKAPTAPAPEKRLILTASRDSFIRVTAIDAPDLEQVRYASILRAGQSVGFDGRKFSVNVAIPAAVNVTLDGVNYGPHSDQEVPETFTVESHQP